MKSIYIVTWILLFASAQSFFVTVPVSYYLISLAASGSFGMFMHNARNRLRRSRGNTSIAPILTQGSFGAMDVSTKTGKVVAVLAKAGLDTVLAEVSMQSYHNTVSHFFETFKELDICMHARNSWLLYLDGRLSFGEAHRDMSPFINSFSPEAFLQFSNEWHLLSAFGAPDPSWNSPYCGLREFVYHDGLVSTGGDSLSVYYSIGILQTIYVFIGLIIWIFKLCLRMTRLIRNVEFNTMMITRLQSLFLDHEIRITNLENRVDRLEKEKAKQITAPTQVQLGSTFLY